MTVRLDCEGLVHAPVVLDVLAGAYRVARFARFAKAQDNRPADTAQREAASVCDAARSRRGELLCARTLVGASKVEPKGIVGAAHVQRRVAGCF